MPKEYRTIQEVAGPLMLVRGVSDVAYDELGEIELANGEKRRCKVLEIDDGNALVQLSLTLLWVSLAFITMSLASRKQIRSVWILGASILFIVTLKLVLFDLSHIGTLTRVISFLGAGLVMLIIAYIAPIPESEQAIKNEVG